MWNSTQVGWSQTPAQFRGRASEKGSGSPWEGGSCRSPPKSRRGPSSAHHCALPAPELPVVIRSIVSRPWQHNGPWDFQTRLHSLEAGTEAAGMGIRVVIQKGRTDQHCDSCDRRPPEDLVGGDLQRALPGSGQVVSSPRSIR